LIDWNRSLWNGFCKPALLIQNKFWGGNKCLC
jgi:hypothetical protein